MVELEGIRARADAARAPCAAYWLIVFTCLMIHLFPVANVHSEPVFQRNGSITAVFAGGDWLPPAGADETPIVPRAQAFVPEAVFSALADAAVSEAQNALVRLFDPRGPPLQG